jgi:aminoglycoside phosphotransferase family enzyme/predicted kinase
MSHQADIFQAMARPDFYPHTVSRVEQKETHASRVFLTGHFVFKVKKAVDLEFLDYTSLDKRKFYCHQETLLNRRLSQDIYIGVVPIFFNTGCYSMEGPGQVIEYAVKMRQLPEQCSMMQLLRRGKIDRQAARQLALKLAEFYNQASTGEEINVFGASEVIRTNCEENFLQTDRFVGNMLDKQMHHKISTATHSFFEKRKALFDERVKTGKIRDCHGDLRSGHIYWTDTIQVIDCIEFNERFRYSDTVSDMAFLIMDMEFENLPEIGHHLLDCYVQNTDDPGAYLLVDFYKCYRAMVRAKVNCIRLENRSLGQREKIKLRRETDRYLELAYHYAKVFTHPTIWVICGMVASGKSTIATEIAGRLGVGVLSSDLIRKDLFGLQPEDSRDLPFEEGLYTKSASSLTYNKLFKLAREEIANGLPVVLDATFSSKLKRKEILHTARDEQVNIFFVESTAPDKVIKDRLMLREGRNTVSDARLHHFEQFKSRFEPLTELNREIHVSIDTQLPVKENIVRILSSHYNQLSKKISGGSAHRL